MNKYGFNFRVWSNEFWVPLMYSEGGIHVVGEMGVNRVFIFVSVEENERGFSINPSDHTGRTFFY